MQLNFILLFTLIATGFKDAVANDDECRSQTQQLTSSASVQDALDSVIPSILPTQSTGNTFTLQLDYASSDQSQYEQACDEVGGDYTTDSFSLTCSNAGQTTNLIIVDYPVCLSPICSASTGDLQDMINEAFSIADTFGGQTGAAYTGCTADDLSEAGGGGGSGSGGNGGENGDDDSASSIVGMASAAYFFLATTWALF